MINWEKAEIKAFEWVKKNFDPNAQYKGGSNANESDILLSDGTYVEVKSPKSQCGQFTTLTANKNPYSKNIMSGSCTQNDVLNWIYYHYSQKNVSYFFVDGILYPIYDFIFKSSAVFQLEGRSGSGKKSGSSSLPKKYYNMIPEEWNYVTENGKCYVYGHENERWFCEQYNFEMYVSKRNGEIRKLSNTNNPTWIFSMEI